MKKLILGLLLSLLAHSAWAYSCSAPSSFSSGTTASSSAMNTNFTNVMGCISSFIGGTTSGTASAQTVSVQPTLSALSAGIRVTFMVGTGLTNPSGGTSLTVGSTTTTQIKKKTSQGLVALGAGDLVQNQVYTVQYDGSVYELLDPTAPLTNIVNSWSAGQINAPFSLTYSSTITPDFSTGNVFTVTLTGNTILANPANLAAGQCGQIFITQDGTGSRTISSYGGYWKFPGGTAPTLTTTANATDILSFCSWSTTQVAAQLTSNVK